MLGVMDCLLWCPSAAAWAVMHLALCALYSEFVGLLVCVIASRLGLHLTFGVPRLSELAGRHPNVQVVVRFALLGAGDVVPPWMCPPLVCCCSIAPCVFVAYVAVPAYGVCVWVGTMCAVGCAHVLRFLVVCGLLFCVLPGPHLGVLLPLGLPGVPVRPCFGPGPGSPNRLLCFVACVLLPAHCAAPCPTRKSSDI